MKISVNFVSNPDVEGSDKLFLESPIFTQEDFTIHDDDEKIETKACTSNFTGLHRPGHEDKTDES